MSLQGDLDNKESYGRGKSKDLLSVGVEQNG